MVFYKNKWGNENITLSQGIWPSTLVNTGEAAAILNCSIRTLERYRHEAIGPEPEPIDSYVGNPRFYFVWKLIVWKSRITGNGPKTENAVWEWFMTQPVKGRPRSNPQPRPEWWPRGMRGKKAKSRRMNQIMRKYWEIELRRLDREFEGFA